MKQTIRKTKIVCTLGPACRSKEILTAMCKAGMNVARLNFSHGDYKEHSENINLIKEVRNELRAPIAILLDTKGPEYRIKTFEKGSIMLQEGDKFSFTTEDIIGNEKKVSVTYEGLTRDLDIGDVILLNNGLMKFTEEKYMQTIEDGPRGEELELDNNPQAPVLQQPEYFAIGK